MGCLGMIRTISAASQTPLNNDDIEICQRVLDDVCILKGISAKEAREEVAASIIRQFQQGIKSEESLKRLFS